MLTACYSRVLAAISACACACPALANEQSFSADRPDFVESSQVVGNGRLQIESSVMVARTTRYGMRRTHWSTPTLIRLGISDNVELRVESAGAVRQRSSEPGTAITTARGYADASLGLKWHAQDADGAQPSVAVLLHTDLGTGSAAVREEGTRPSARVVAEWDLGHDVSLGVMPGIAYRKEARKVSGVFGVVLGKAWNQRLRGFVELATPRIASVDSGGTKAEATLGAAYLVGKNVQLDAALSRGLNRRSAGTTLTVGLSFRL